MHQKSTSKAKAVPLRCSILTRAVLQSVLLSFVTITVLSTLAFIVASSLVEQRVISQLSQLVSSKEDLIEEVLQSDRERAALLASREGIIRVLHGEAGKEVLEDLIGQMALEGTPVTGIAIFDEAVEPVERVGALISLPEDFVHTDVTFLFPSIGRHTGWEGYQIIVPLKEDGIVIGTLVIRHDVQRLLQVLLSAPSLGKTGEVLLGKVEKGKLVLLHHNYSDERKEPISLEKIEEQYQSHSSLADAIHGDEGINLAKDHKGEKVFVASRTLNSLGWWLVVKVNVDETFKSINVMAITFILIGTALLIGVGLFAFIFARKLTKPLIRLSSVVSLLKPGNWNYHRSTKAKDEVGVLDHVISDMAARLKVSYENLEEEVRRRTEELRQQYLRDRTILETIEHGVVVVGCDSSIQDMNSGALKIIGKNKKEDVIGKNAEKIFPLAQRTRESIDEDHPIQNCLKTKKTYRSRPSDHLNLIMKNQEILPITLEATPLLQDDELIGAVVVIQDVTEERRVDYLKSEFISLASHQLRTPLSTIKWYMEIFEEEKSGNFTAVQIESLQEMTRATKRMSNMVETLLRAAQLEGKGTEVNKQNVNITEFIHDAGEELGNLAKDAKVSCKVDVPENPVEIYTDPLLLHIAFQNLFSNAVKYSKAGQSIHITLKEEADYILISVKDEGIGIPKSEQKRIFWRLFRAKNAIKTDTEGNGLGLYISKMVIDVLGGKIAFTSEEGKGTTFTVKLSKQ